MLTSHIINSHGENEEYVIIYCKIVTAWIVIYQNRHATSGLSTGRGEKEQHNYIYIYIYFSFVCFTRYLVFRIAVLPHRPGVVYNHLLLRRETRIPGVAPFSFRIGSGIFLCIGDRNPIHPLPLGSCGPLQE